VALDILLLVPGRGNEAKLKVVLCQNFKYRCQRKVVKNVNMKSQVKLHCWVYDTKG